MPQMQIFATSLKESKSGRDMVDSALSDVFRLLEAVVTDLANHWQIEEVEQNGRYVLDTLLPQLNDAPALARSAYWLVVRLGI